eukprot:7690878-Ditylum_brightwellii.AAC.1
MGEAGGSAKPPVCKYFYSTPKCLCGGFYSAPKCRRQEKVCENEKCTHHHMPALQRTQMNLDVLVILQEDEGGKLEALPSTSLLFWMLGIKVGKLDALPFCVVSSPGGKLDILPFLFLRHQSTSNL